MQVNQCDLRCPRKAYMAAEYREATNTTPPTLLNLHRPLP